MKRLLTLLLAAALAMTACGQRPSSAPEQETGMTGTSTTVCWSNPPASSWSVTEDITISLSQDIFPVGTEHFTVTLTNTGDRTIAEYGESYSFQFNDGSGWKDAETIDNYAFNMPAYLLYPGQSRTLDVSTWFLKSPLKEGRCRIVGSTLRTYSLTDSLDDGGTGAYTEHPAYVLEFDIQRSASAPQAPVYPTEAPLSGSDLHIYLEIPQPEQGASRLAFTVVNGSGADAEILFIPTLEMVDEDGGISKVPFAEDVGFCGTPDPLPQGRKDWSTNIEYLWGCLQDGYYRLSYTVTAADGREVTASGWFLYEDGLCSLPKAE